MSEATHSPGWGMMRGLLEQWTARLLRGYALVMVDDRGQVDWGADYSGDPLIQREIERTCRRFAREARKLQRRKEHMP